MWRAVLNGQIWQPHQVGGGNEESDWLLKANTKYLVRATSEEAANNITITVKGHE